MSLWSIGQNLLYFKTQKSSEIFMNGLIFFKKRLYFLNLEFIWAKKMFFFHSFIHFVIVFLYTLVEGGMPGVFISDTCYLGPEWY